MMVVFLILGAVYLFVAHQILAMPLEFPLIAICSAASAITLAAITVGSKMIQRF